MGMDLNDFLQRYTEEVYLARDPEAAARFIADPCLRHEPGELVVMSLADNIARIRGFLESAPELAFSNAVVVEQGEFLVSCYNIRIGAGDDDSEGTTVISGVEMFRVVDGKITETWNSPAQAGAWG